MWDPETSRNLSVPEGGGAGTSELTARKRRHPNAFCGLENVKERAQMRRQATGDSKDADMNRLPSIGEENWRTSSGAKLVKRPRLSRELIRK